MNYIYNEQIIEVDITCDEIIKLVDIIDSLKCKNMNRLLNYYSKVFPVKLTNNNWLNLLVQVYNEPKYIELEKQILNYYNNTILYTINNSLDIENLYNGLKNINKDLMNQLYYSLLTKYITFREETKEKEINQKMLYNKKLVEEIEIEVESDSESSEYSDSDENTETNIIDKMSKSKKTKKLKNRLM